MTAPPLQLELLNPGSLALCRAYNSAYPDSYWEPPPPAARTARVDPPAGHQDDFAILYLGVHVAATAAEARLLQQDVRRQWFISRDSAKHYALATYTLAKPAVLLPIDGPNQAGLGLDPVTMAFEDDHGVDVRHPTRNLATVGDLAAYVQSLRVEPERTRPYVA